MRLVKGKVVLQIKFDGYQFPELENVRWDSDWLNVRISLALGDFRWEKVDPSLTTFEVQWLIDWMEEVAANAEVFRSWRSERLTSRIFFTEPNLGFEALSGSYEGAALTFRLYLAAESLPTFQDKLSGYDSSKDIQEVWLDLPVEASDLQDAAHSLQRQLAEFPVRVGLPPKLKE
ncbi:hypothetical protein ACI3L1_03955 [Deinococcus sp. SM5_A1]|uniref:WapI family immunity protein n=1 Tax=Deinococcus sp. SM5_A1 TaxID=3379094 RepID=UPI00385D5758